MAEVERLKNRKAPIDMDSEEFRRLGHRLVDQVAELLDTLRNCPVTPGESPAIVRQALRADRSLADDGMDAGMLMEGTTNLLKVHSLFNGHPRFWGYITSSAAPVGILGEMLAAAVNANVGAWTLSPMASEIEAQTVRWISEFIGYRKDCGGLLVSGGNMANFICFLAARTSQAEWEVRQTGLNGKQAKQLRVYATRETHTWIMKAADLFGLGTDSIQWIETDKKQRMVPESLRQRIETDRARGEQPMLVVGTAGSVSTGTVDLLDELASVCHESEVWFHVDGAYGGFAAHAPGAPEELRGLSKADSVAVDPHKWLYAPLEAGCALVRDADALRKTFAYHPPYYHFGEETTNYVDLGMQNSRGFRALKVWLALQQVGRAAYLDMIGDDIALSKELARSLLQHPELELITQELSTATFRYIPLDLLAARGKQDVEKYLNELNTEILKRIEKSGEAFLSNAVVDNKFVLRACIVNFRTTLEDVQALPAIVLRLGREADRELRPQKLHQ
ncbi:MAG: amino acid decarboxylase [Acidobacteria bacterium RIFCSPLOWO2_12_FULL_54_10]|nr:MAG: amino acid decarboxylase [Acidobacteria bacterium RIFCSPLOWO2_12_FULL_54_10]